MKKLYPIIIVLIFLGTGLWAQSFTAGADFSIVLDDADVEIDTETLTVYGFGFNDSRNLMMSRQTANTKATQMISTQTKGNPFEYTKNDGISLFYFETNDTISGIQVVDSIMVGRTGILAISAVETEVAVPKGKEIINVSLEYPVDDDGDPVDYRLDRILYMMMEEAVEKVMEEKNPGGGSMSGMIYVSGLKVEF